MRLSININMDNEAFELDNALEVARILKAYINTICNNGKLTKGNSEILIDSNGNKVGSASVNK